jgi:hypothetical protein
MLDSCILVGFLVGCKDNIWYTILEFHYEIYFKGAYQSLDFKYRAV